MSLNLCNSCVEDHLDNDPSRHNLNLSNSKKETLVLSILPKHSTKRCKNYCQQCDEPVFPFCIASNFYKKHTFQEISDISKRRKETITDDTKEIVSPEYACIVQQVDYDAGKLEEDYEILKQSIENKLTKWHEEIDKLVNMLQNETDYERYTNESTE